MNKHLNVLSICQLFTLIDKFVLIYQNENSETQISSLNLSL